MAARTAIVFPAGMKDITFSAPEGVVEAARERARREHTTLNEAFREWLGSCARISSGAERAAGVVRQVRGRVGVGRHLSRDEMNAR